jgi:2-haloacid dehalogenase
MSKQIILAFDAYGTLLSTESIAQQLASHFGEEKANTIAQTWRKYQLEYTWRLNSMSTYLSPPSSPNTHTATSTADKLNTDQYEPFSTLTQKSLLHALTESGLSLPQPEIDSLMRAYNTLSLFPDVSPLFTHLSSSPHITAVIFSNGTKSMITSTLSESEEIAPYAHLFKDVVVVEPVQKFKPHPDVYGHLCREVGKGKEGEEKEVWLVSGNPFDVVGANAYGMRTCWVDRSGAGWQDGLVGGEKGRPTIVVGGVDEVVGKVEDFITNKA